MSEKLPERRGPEGLGEPKDLLTYEALSARVKALLARFPNNGDEKLTLRKEEGSESSGEHRYTTARQDVQVMKHTIAILKTYSPEEGDKFRSGEEQMNDMVALSGFDDKRTAITLGCSFSFTHNQDGSTTPQYVYHFFQGNESITWRTGQPNPVPYREQHRIASALGLPLR